MLINGFGINYVSKIKKVAEGLDSFPRETSIYRLFFMKLKMSEVKHFAFLLTQCAQIPNVCYCKVRVFSYRLVVVEI